MSGEYFIAAVQFQGKGDGLISHYLKYFLAENELMLSNHRPNN